MERKIRGHDRAEALDQAAFDTWAAEPTEVPFPTREFADAISELNLVLEAAAPLIPETNRH